MNDILEALACRPPRGVLLQAQPGRTAGEAAAALRWAQVAVQRELPEGQGIAHDESFAGLSQNFGAPPP